MRQRNCLEWPYLDCQQTAQTVVILMAQTSSIHPDAQRRA
jgi:hypothetical protein